MWELLSLLSSPAHVTGIVQAVFYGVPDPTGQVVRPLDETCETGGTRLTAEAPAQTSSGEQQVCSTSWLKTRFGYKQGV